MQWCSPGRRWDAVSDYGRLGQVLGGRSRNALTLHYMITNWDYFHGQKGGIMDNYVEYLVKGENPVLWKALFVILLALDLCCVLLALSSFWGMLILLPLLFLTYQAWLNMSVEYEYLYIGGSFSIEKILNKSSRKSVLDTNNEELLLVGPVSLPEVKAAVSSSVVKDYSGKGGDERKYAYIYQRNGQKYLVYIDMPEKLLREMRQHSPSKVSGRL